MNCKMRHLLSTDGFFLLMGITHFDLWMSHPLLIDPRTVHSDTWLLQAYVDQFKDEVPHRVKRTGKDKVVEEGSS